MESVRRILEGRRVALEAVTNRLIETEVIDGEELKAIVEASTGAPQLVPGTAALRSSPSPQPAARPRPEIGRRSHGQASAVRPASSATSSPR